MNTSDLRLTGALSTIRTTVFGRSKMRQREAIEGLLFTLPWLLGMLVFFAVPVIASFLLSFAKYDIVRAPEFVGLSNYKTAFMNDKLFWPSLHRTFYYAVISVPVGLAGSLAAALLLNQGLHGTTFFRTFFFLPSLTPSMAAAFIWRWLLNPEVGLVNHLLWQVGIQGPRWMGSTTWVIPSLILVSLWQSIGGTRMLIFLAGLQGVPEELYDAAEVDGANSWHKFRHVTLPMISPTFFFNLVLGIIGALQVFTLAYTATDGGPGRASWFFALHIYRNAFELFYMGYASSLAWLFLFLILALTLVNFQLSGRWVYYEGEVKS
ncbi:MAG: sugar ABC transporter permease [Candidatus Hadarchaeota archaeon]|nr:sugar ABC transporter permease [Candidatus Hadarchaeota archaeon]